MGKALTLKWKGTPGKSYEGLEAKALAGAQDGLNTIGLVTINHIKSSILRGPKSGLVYAKYNPRRDHRASAPGEYPANDTDRLAGSLDYEPGGTMIMPEVEMFARAEYAIALELKPSSKGGRPFMSRGVSEKRGDYPGILKAAIAERIK